MPLSTGRVFSGIRRLRDQLVTSDSRLTGDQRLRRTIVTSDSGLTTSDFLEDSSRLPGGHAAGVLFPRGTQDVVDIVTAHSAILPIGAQSSLTGGATPMGELILAMSKMARILEIGPGRITVEPGVTVAAMQERLAESDAWFPPSPTFTGACAGGIVATNAAGAATFKYGSTRNWVEALTVVLADGTVLELERGAQRARGHQLELETKRGRLSVPVPTYQMPRVPKRSAGYHAERDIDPIDLFIGSEGTLGVITRITFRTVNPAPNIALSLIPCTTEAQALGLVTSLRNASIDTWRTGAAGIDACAIEHLDRRSLEIVREDGADARHQVMLPGETDVVLIVQLELGAAVDQSTAFDQIQNALTDDRAGSPLAAFCRMLDRAGVLADTEIALPQNRRRIADLLAIREAVPAGVNQRVSTAKRTIDRRIEKTAADMVAPFDRFAEMMSAYRRGFETRGLDYAIWGHLSDGNVHPNVIPRSFDDVIKGQEAMLEFGREIARLGGCPLAEHGVGRNPVKQTLLRELYGHAGVEEMRAVKRALDPDWRLAPGVIFAK
jgi:D-lactate dehydrogenase (cytochrome)